MNIRQLFSRAAKDSGINVVPGKSQNESIAVVADLFGSVGMFNRKIAGGIENPDKILAAESLTAYQDMFDLNPKVYSCLNTRWNAVLGVKMSVIPASEDSADLKKADAIKFVFKQMVGSTRDLNKSILSAQIPGFKIIETIWEPAPYDFGDFRGFHGIRQFKPKPSEVIGFDTDNYLNIKPNGVLVFNSFSNQFAGTPCPYSKFFHVVYDQENCNPYGKSLLRSLYFYHEIQKMGIKDAAKTLAKYACPVKLATINWEMLEKQLKAMAPNLEKAKLAEAVGAAVKDLDTALNNAQQGNNLVVFNWCTITVLTGAAVTDALFDKQQNLINKLIAEVILGASLNTSQSTDGAGSRSQSEVHERVTESYTLADIAWLESCYNETTNSPIKQFCDFNFADNSTGYPQIKFEIVKAETQGEIIEKIDTANRWGIPVSKAAAAEQLGIDPSEEGEELINEDEPPLAVEQMNKGEEEEEKENKEDGRAITAARGAKPVYDPIPLREKYLDNLGKEISDSVAEEMFKLKTIILNKVKIGVEKGDYSTLNKLLFIDKMAGDIKAPGWLSALIYRGLITSTLNGALVANTYLKKVNPARSIRAQKPEGFADKMLETDEVYQYFKSLIGMTKPEFNALSIAFQNQAIAFAGIEQAKVIKDVQMALLETLNKGGGLNDFNKLLSESFVKYTGTVYGSADLIGADITPYHAETIFRTNTARAYVQGEKLIWDDAGDFILAFTYRGIGDDRERDSHLSLEGVTLAKDDPLIKWPPLSYQCRCSLTPIVKGEVVALTDRAVAEALLSKVGFDIKGG